MHSARRVDTPLKGFLFDLDGTLVQTPIDFAGMKRSILDLAEEYGLDPVGLNQYDILGIIEEAERQLEAVSLPRPFRDLAEEKLVRYEIQAADVAEELPGALATLTQLRASGIPVGIVTRNSRVAVARALIRVSLPHDVLLTRNDVRRAKPDPQHLLEAARRLGIAPERCAMVGDHPMDMQAGRAAGMFCVAVQTRDPSPDAFAAVSPDVILPGVGDLLGWLARTACG